MIDVFCYFCQNRCFKENDYKLSANNFICFKCNIFLLEVNLESGMYNWAAKAISYNKFAYFGYWYLNCNSFRVRLAGGGKNLIELPLKDSGINPSNVQDKVKMLLAFL